MVFQHKRHPTPINSVQKVVPAHLQNFLERMNLFRCRSVTFAGVRFKKSSLRRRSRLFQTKSRPQIWVTMILIVVKNILLVTMTIAILYTNESVKVECSDVILTYDSSGWKGCHAGCSFCQVMIVMTPTN